MNDNDEAIERLGELEKQLSVPELTPAVLDLGVYDRLLAAGGDHA